MAEEETNEATEEKSEDVDEYGLAIQKYLSTVLVVVPPEAYAETTLRYARSSLYNVHVGTRSVSSSADDLIKGAFQDEFMVDGQLAGETMEPYSGVIFVGGPGALAVADDPNAQALARQACEQQKLIGAWGHGVAVLARAGVVRGRKVTGDPSLEAEIRKAGGRYTGVQVQRDGHLVTAVDDAAGMRFGQRLVEIVGIR